MSKYELNGRQIKNVVPLALTLSMHEGVGLKQRHIDETLEMMTEFLTSLHFYCYFVNSKRSQIVYKSCLPPLILEVLSYLNVTQKSRVFYEHNRLVSVMCDIYVVINTSHTRT